MNTDSNNIPFPGSDDATPAPDAHVEPAHDATPQAAADEMLAHGLLTYLHNDKPEMQSQRVDRVMGSIAEELHVSAGAPASRFRFPIRTAKAWMAMAACVALVATATFIGFPGETSAQAVVEQSIAAMRASGPGGADRRYEVLFTVLGENNTDVQLKPATVDMRAPNQLLLLATAPDGHQVIAGRDEKGDWCYRLERDGGGVERDHPQQAWPRWSKVGEESLFADSVDRLLEELTKGYTLSRESDATLAGHSGTLRHIVANRKQARGPGGDKVEIWIDKATSVVERIEMKWNDPPTPPVGQEGARGQGGGDDRPLGPPGGPGRGPRGRGAQDGPPNDNADGDRPPHPRHPPRRDGGPDDGLNGGPDRDPMDGPPPPGGDRPRPPHPRPGADAPDDQGPGDGPRGDRPRPGMGPNGRGGPGMGGPGPGGVGPGGPRGPGDRRLPPKLLIIQRVEAPNFAEGWFSPEAHAEK